MDTRQKFQAPGSNLQRNTRLQSSMHMRAASFGAWGLKILWCLELGIWSFASRAAKKQSQTVHHHDDGAAFVADHANRQRNSSQHCKRHQDNHRAEGNDKILADDAARALAEAEGGE